MNRILFMLFFLGLLASVPLAGGQAQEVNEEITEAQSGLVFDPPALQGGYRRFIKSVNGHGDVSIIANYGPPSDLLPRAVIILDKAGPNRYVSDKLTWEELRDGLSFTKNKNLKISSPLKAETGIGKIDYAFASSQEMACILFQEYFGSRGFGAGYGDKRLLGFYCEKGSARLTNDFAKQLLARLGHVDYGLPAGTQKPSANKGGIVFSGKPYRVDIDWAAAVSPDPPAYVTGTATGDSIRFLTDDRDLCEGAFKPNNGWWLLCDTGIYAEGTRVVRNDGTIELKGMDRQKQPVVMTLKPGL